MDFLKDPLKVVADWLLGILTGWGMPDIAAQILIGFLGIFILIALLMVLDISWCGSSARWYRAFKTASVRTGWVRLD